MDFLANAHVAIHPQVKQALDGGEPVVALESTIISHGMPYPQNLETARALEGIVRQGGAIPATVALLDGKLCIGLDDAQIERIAKGGPKNVQKVAKRDIPRTLVRRAMGATTVSGTLAACKLAKIAVFATGGIGGVHREVFESLDISADLSELASTDVCIVCAGAKSILDIPKTLEALETMGVAVSIWNSDEFPAFYHGSSGVYLPTRIHNAQEIAHEMLVKWQMGFSGGLLLAVPIPSQHALDPDVIEEKIQRALTKAQESGISGKEITPFLLAALHAETGGSSLEANVALVKNNARIAAQVACEFASLAKTLD